MKILLVEDEEILAKSLGHKLTEKGFEVVLASDGVQARGFLDQNFDLILLDLMMPTVDGWQLLSEINGRIGKIIVTSNLSQTEDINKAKQMGANEFLIKSNVTLKEIVEVVERLLGLP